MKIGKGGEGEVYTVRHTGTNQLMLMKIILDTGTEEDLLSPVKQERFQQVVEQIRINNVGIN